MVIGNTQSQPEKTSEKNALAQKIERSAAARDKVTNRLLAELITSKRTPRRFVQDACKFAGIKPPGEGEALAPYVLSLQIKVCKFEKTDTSAGSDGKVGPITFASLLKEIPQLKIYSTAERTAPYRKKIRELANKSGLPVPSQSSAPSKKLDVASENPDSITPNKTALIGDSLIDAGFAKPFYKGTDKYKKYRGKLFRSGRSIFDMDKRADKYMPTADAYVIGAAANDLYYGKIDKLEQAFRSIIQKAQVKNPNARIVLLTLHGDTYTKWGRNRQRVNSKIKQLNDRLRVIAQSDPNISLVDIRSEIYAAEKNGKDILGKDKLHYSYKGAKAVAALLQDELANGRHSRLTDYA